MTKPRAPVLAKDLARAELTALDGADVEKALLEGGAVASQRASRVCFDGVLLRGIKDLSETRVDALSLLDVVAERCQLALTEWPAARLTRIEFRDCRLTGVRWNEAQLEDVRFVGCQLDYASFANARFHHVAFERCRMQDGDFGGADLTGTLFGECELRGVDFGGAKLSGVDVCTSSLIDVRLVARDVRGIVVNPVQAAMLARLFGVVVKE